MANANSSVRSLPYPAIEGGNFSFPNADYKAEPQLVGTTGTKVKIKHSISGAPLIEGLIKSGDARYGCTVAVPKTGYRRLEMAESDVQTISWDMDIVGEPPILGPCLLYVGEKRPYQLKDSDGIAKVWVGRKIDLSKGFRLARSQYLRPAGSLQSLIDVVCKKEMSPGTYTVTPNTNGGFYFNLNAAEDIYRLLQNPQGQNQSTLRMCVITHAVSQCFGILKQDYGGEEGDETNEWEQHSNLRALSDWLSGMDMAHWSDPGFDAMETATRIYPAKIPDASEGAE